MSFQPCSRKCTLPAASYDRVMNTCKLKLKYTSGHITDFTTFLASNIASLCAATWNLPHGPVPALKDVQNAQRNNWAPLLCLCKSFLSCLNESQGKGQQCDGLHPVKLSSQQVLPRQRNSGCPWIHPVFTPCLLLWLEAVVQQSCSDLATKLARRCTSGNLTPFNKVYMLFLTLIKDALSLHELTA